MSTQGRPALVPSDQIEQIVGARRHQHQHIGRSVTSEQIVYVLHSQRCKDSGVDLRECAWSRALNRGIDPDGWRGYEDRPVVLGILRRRLFPLVPDWLEALRISPPEGDGGS